jgi:hypothetical protein
MLIKKTSLSAIKTLGILIIISFILLFAFEIRSYYFPSGKMDNDTLISLLKEKINSDVNVNNKEDYVNIYHDTEFEDIFNYLEKNEDYESSFLNKGESLGCFDNDILIQDIKGKGETCKTVSPSIKNPFEENLIHSNGNKYSFANICPVTAGQERPISCLYEQGNHIQKINKKLGNLIDLVQQNHGNRLNNMESSVSNHIVDPKRLHNISHVQEYNTHENNMNMGIERRFNNLDQLDDLVAYTNKLKQ